MSNSLWWIFPSLCSWRKSLNLSNKHFSSVQCSSVSHVWLFATPWTEAHQASLSITNSQSLLKFMSIESVMPSNHLILRHPLLLLPSIFPSIRVFFQWVDSSHQVAKVLELQFFIFFTNMVLLCVCKNICNHALW